MSLRDAEHALNLEISENESRKDFSKSERIEYARRLERIEAAKAKERMIATQDNDAARAALQNFAGQVAQGNARDIVAEKLSIGSGFQYEKEKYIVDNKEKFRFTANHSPLLYVRNDLTLPTEPDMILGNWKCRASDHFYDM